jgi:hypothetical protein
VSAVFTQVRGVYVIDCAATGEVYVGSSGVTGTRLSQHVTDLRRGKHHNAGLQAAWNQCGEVAFRFLMVQSLPPGGEDDLTAAEAAWVEALAACEPGLGFNRYPVRRRTVANRGD